MSLETCSNGHKELAYSKDRWTDQCPACAVAEEMQVVIDELQAKLDKAEDDIFNLDRQISEMEKQL